MQTFHYFPSAIHREEEPEWLNTFKIEELWDKNHVPENLLLQSENLAYNSNFFNFKKHLESIAVDILGDGGYQVDKYEIKSTTIWGQKITAPAHHHIHVHGNSIFSGFYILETTENCPYPIFGDPRPGKQMGDIPALPSEMINDSTLHIHFNNIIPGSLFIFNSWLPHQFTGGQPQSEVKFLHFIITANEK